MAVLFPVHHVYTWRLVSHGWGHVARPFILHKIPLRKDAVGFASCCHSWYASILNAKALHVAAAAVTIRMCSSPWRRRAVSSAGKGSRSSDRIQRRSYSAHARSIQTERCAEPASSVDENRKTRMVLCSALDEANSVPLRALLSAWRHERGLASPALYVPTAYALRPDATERSTVIRASIANNFDLQVDSLDINEYGKWATKDENGQPKPDANAMKELEARIAEASMLFVGGGNTFYLQAAVLQAGFGDILRRHVGAFGLPYVGQSAGGIIAGETVATAFWKGWDDPKVVPQFNFAEDTDLARGMDLLRGRTVFPHYDPVAHAALVDRRRKELAFPERLVTLAEDEAWVWTCDGTKSHASKL